MESFTFKPSISEKHGIDLIKDSDINILSIGISTAGSTEIEMSKRSPDSHIVATTLDEEGLSFTRKIIAQYKLDNRIELKLEDVSKKLPYADNHFDFIYARLVLHYLDNKQLEQTLKELRRILKKDGLFYIVVRSQNEWEAKLPGTTYDAKTGLTRYPVYQTLDTDNVKYLSRRLHTIDSLQAFLTTEQFKIQYIKEYQEQLYHDYKRTEKVKYPNTIIECLCQK